MRFWSVFLSFVALEAGLEIECFLRFLWIPAGIASGPQRVIIRIPPSHIPYRRTEASMTWAHRVNSGSSQHGGTALGGAGGSWSRFINDSPSNS